VPCTLKTAAPTITRATAAATVSPETPAVGTSRGVASTATITPPQYSGAPSATPPATVQVQAPASGVSSLTTPPASQVPLVNDTLLTEIPKRKSGLEDEVLSLLKKPVIVAVLASILALILCCLCNCTTRSTPPAAKYRTVGLANAVYSGTEAKPMAHAPVQHSKAADKGANGRSQLPIIIPPLRRGAARRFGGGF
jgi:hypothetical protein